MHLAQTRLFTSSDSVLYRDRWVHISCCTLKRLKLCVQVVWGGLSCPKSFNTLFSIWPVATFFSWINNPPICVLLNYWCMLWNRRPRPRLTCHWCDWLSLNSAAPYSICVTSISHSSVQVPLLDIWGNHTVLGYCSFTKQKMDSGLSCYPHSFLILHLLRKLTMVLLQKNMVTIVKPL